MPLQHNRLMDSCSYVRKKYITSRQRGVHLHLPYPPKSATAHKSELLQLVKSSPLNWIAACSSVSLVAVLESRQLCPMIALTI